MSDAQSPARGTTQDGEPMEMTRSLKVNFILPGYTAIPIGGYRVIFEYANWLASRGHAVRAIFPMTMSNELRSESLIEQAKRPMWRLKTRLKNRPLVPWHVFHPGVRLRLVSDLSDRSVPNADICVATGWPTAQPVAELARSKGTKFYVIQHHETMFGPPDTVNATWLLPLHKVVISKWLEVLGHELGASDMRHIPNGINFDLFRISIPPEKRPMRIVSLFHTEAFKGIPDALAVLERYHVRFPHVPVTFFGVPARTSDIPDWITYVRNPNQSELVQEIYNRGTIYLGASLAEGWALPPAEAMACGCAFVGTDIGGFRDYARHDDTALLSPAGDRDGMLKNLEAITTDPALRARIQTRGTENIREFTWQRAGSALERYFFEHVERALA